MTTRLSWSVSASLPLHPYTTRGSTAQGPSTTFTITLTGVLFLHFSFKYLSSSIWLNAVQSVHLKKTWKQKRTFLKTKAVVVLIFCFLFNRPRPSVARGDSAETEKAAFSRGRPHNVIKSLHVVLVPVCGVRTLPSIPSPLLEVFFFLKVLTSQ